MAGYNSIAAVGMSITRTLNAWFEVDGPTASLPVANLVTTEDFVRSTNGSVDSELPLFGVSIFVYRIDYNRTMRAAWSGVGSRDGLGHLPLDLHFLLTPWAENAQHELQVLGRAMQCLETTPILAGPMLDPLGEWELGDAVQVVLGEITTEEVMRTFETLPYDYKLSVPYIARVVRIDSPEPDTYADVLEAHTAALPSSTP